MMSIAVLYPGAMGRALAEALAPFGWPLVSFLAERGSRTQENARVAGVRALASFCDLVETADMVISAVPPGAALDVAREYAEALRASPRRTAAKPSPLFVDANSISPSRVVAIDRIVRAAGARFVDAVFLGPSTPINARTLFMLSGLDASAAAAIFAPAIATKVIGEGVGQASAVKMSIALLTKALMALFLEMSCASAKADCLPAALEVMRKLYPGTMEFIERNLPTYRTHAPRRLVEMLEAQSWLDELGERGAMIRAAVTVLERVLDGGLAGDSFEELLGQIVARAPLAEDVEHKWPASAS
jgi:3-hydroxyisobutyrate dehydrogenase-like beta-hydroxyacid dehydrogenase